MATAFWMANFKPIISQESLEIDAKNGNEIEFKALNIDTPNQLYTIETKLELKNGKGINLDIGFLDPDQKLVSNSNQELYNYVSTDSEGSDSTQQNLSSFTEFYSQSITKYSPIIKINDYGQVGQALNPKTTTCIQQELPDCNLVIEKIRINLILYRGGVLWHNWILASIGISLVSGFCFYKSSKTRQKAWE